MAEPATTFVTNFHNLTGDTPKERQQNLFKLLRNLKQNDQEIQSIIPTLKPQNHLEHIFYIDVLIYLRQFEQLYQKFLEGDEIAIKKLSKHDWFYQKAFGSLEPKKFVFELLPSLSLSLKQIVLHRISLNENTADETFELLEERYGIFIASILLPKCSSEKIRKILTQQPIHFNFQQLMTLYNKDSELIYLYIEERVKHVGNSVFLNNNSFLKLVAQTKPEMFAKLLKKYKFQISLGRRTTKHFVLKQKDTIMTRPQAYIQVLNKTKLVRKLGQDLKSILCKKLKNSSEFYWEYLLKFYPRKFQFPIYKSIYNELFSPNFGENIDALTEKELALMYQTPQRQILAQKKLDKENDKIFLKYYTPSSCFKYFVEKLNHMTLNDRVDFIKTAIESCCLDRELDTLFKVFELVSGRFKNDEAMMREKFFDVLFQNRKMWNRFQESHWKCILEIIDIVDHKEEYVYAAQELKITYIYFLIENGQCIKSSIKKWKTLLDYYYCGEMMKLRKNPKACRIFLTEILEIGHPEPDPIIDYDSEIYDCKIVMICKIFNRESPKHMIHVFDHPRILKTIKFVLKICHETDYNYQEAVEYVLCQKSLPQERLEIQKLYFENFKHFATRDAIMWLLKYEPKTLEKNFETFLKHLNDRQFTYRRRSKSRWLWFKKYSHLQLDARLVEFSKTKLSDDEFLDKDIFSQPLSILIPNDSYLDLVKTYIPTEAKVNLDDKEAKVKYLVQSKFIEDAKMTRYRKLALPIILEFCKGDYLQHALAPLYTCLTKIPENETKIFVETLKAVSVQKHAIHLTYLLYDKKTCFQCVETNSIDHLVRGLKYFAKNPSEELWKIIEEKISQIGENEIKLLKYTMRITIPFKFKNLYFQSIWQRVEFYNDKLLRKDLIAIVNKETLKTLEPEFGLKVVEKTIFEAGTNEFLAKMLIYLNTDRKFAKLSEVFLAFKEKFWRKPDFQREARQKLNAFIETLFKEYVEAKKVDLAFSTKFAEAFQSVFSSSDAIQSFILVTLMRLKKQTTQDAAEILLELNRDFEQTYGNFIVRSFIDVTRDYLYSNVFKTSEQQVEICYNIFEIRKSAMDSVLVLGLLPKQQPKEKIAVKLLDEILAEFSKSGEATIQLEFNCYLKSIQF